MRAGDQDSRARDARGDHDELGELPAVGSVRRPAHSRARQREPGRPPRGHPRPSTASTGCAAWCCRAGRTPPTHTPPSPTTISTPTSRERPGVRSPLRPYPRESIDAASRRDRSSASSSTGITSERSPRSLDQRPAFGSGRSRRARRTRTMLSASCGNTDIATTTAVLTSCSAGGIDRSNRRGLARAFAAPEADQHGREPQSVVEPSEQRLRRDVAQQRDAGARQGELGQRDEHGRALTAGEQDPEERPGSR